MIAMEKIDKILELLERKTLTETEMKLLEDFSNSDEEIRSFIGVYRSLSSSLSASEHLPPDLLSSYILFEMGDEPDNKLIPYIRLKIKSHLEVCSVCRNEYNLLINEYNEIKDHVDKSIVNNTKTTVHTTKISLPGNFTRSSSFRYTFATLAVLIVGYFSLFLISSSITPDYKKNIFAENQDGFYKTRGRTSSLFQRGLNSIEKGDYNDAIKYLSDDIREHQNEKSIFYSYYIIGITYLKAAETDFIGLFKSYDKGNVNLAIANLKESIDKNNSGDYESLKLDSYYYIGRAYLLNDDKASAVSNFQKVVDGKGKYSKEAVELIRQMEKN
jgi:tetratricopeptide (TPR) repeat protein